MASFRLVSEALFDFLHAKATSEGKLDEFHLTLILAFCLYCGELGLEDGLEYLDESLWRNGIKNRRGDIFWDAFHP